MLAKLQARWPETTDYLTKLRQLNNDLMVLREVQAAEKDVPSGLDLLVFSSVNSGTTSLTQREYP